MVFSIAGPEWRNWQTRRTQNPVAARPCGFDPLPRHHLSPLASNVHNPIAGTARRGFGRTLTLLGFSRYCGWRRDGSDRSSRSREAVEVFQEQVSLVASLESSRAPALRTRLLRSVTTPV